MNTNVHIDKYDGIIEVKLDKPKVNAIDTSMSKEIADAFKELNEGPIKVILFYDDNISSKPNVFIFNLII